MGDRYTTIRSQIDSSCNSNCHCIQLKKLHLSGGPDSTHTTRTRTHCQLNATTAISIKIWFIRWVGRIKVVYFIINNGVGHRKHNFKLTTRRQGKQIAAKSQPGVCAILHSSCFHHIFTLLFALPFRVCPVFFIFQRHSAIFHVIFA